MAKIELKWTELNPFDTENVKSDLSDKCQVLFKAYKDQYAKAKEARELFEAQLSREAVNGKHIDPSTDRLAFSYNFGRLSVAIAPKDTAKASKAAPGWAGLKA